MVTRVSNKDTNRYKYTKRKSCLKEKAVKKSDISFGNILANIQILKENGSISVANVNDCISKVMKKSISRKIKI